MLLGLDSFGASGYLYWYEAGSMGDGESGPTPGLWHRSDWNQTGINWDQPGDPPMAQQGTMLPDGSVVPTYPNIATGDTRVNMSVQDAIATASQQNSTWAMLSPGIKNSALFVGAVLGAEALYNYAAAPAVGVPEATLAPAADAGTVATSAPEYSAFADTQVAVPDFTSADEALNVSESFTQEAQTLATQNIAAPAVQQAAQQTVAASGAATAAAQSGGTLATVKGYLAAAAAALTLTRQAVSAYRGTTPYGPQINPATGQPYTGINPATGRPYFTQGQPYGTSGTSMLLPLAAIAALFVLKG